MPSRTVSSSLPLFRLLRAAAGLGVLLALMFWMREQALEGGAAESAASRWTLNLALWLGGGFTVAAMGFTWYRARRDHRDLRRIVEGASRFSNDELSFQIPRSGEPEWDRVTVSLNRMAETLRGQFEELRRQRGEQTTILESMNSSLIAVDRDHYVLTANRAAEAFFQLEAGYRGRLLEEVLREPALNRIVEESLRLGETRRLEFESSTVTGRRLSVSSQQMFDERQESVGAVLIVDDVTEMRKLESMRSDFAANVSHELRTPITSIRGYAETLQEVGAGDREQFLKFTGIIQRNADRLEAIIEDLLTLASLERPGPLEEADLEPMDLRSIHLEVKDRMHRLSSERGIELRFEGSDEVEVLTRGDLLVEALSNLVSNAVRYGPPAVPVLIRTRLDEASGLLTTEVEDRGPGIPERHVPRLFERFYRVDKSRSRADGGTGLGLAIVKHIALVHGGEISVHTRVGEGSRFSLSIPRARKLGLP